MSEEKKIRIVCIGDSITEGFGLGNDPSVYYPSLLGEFLGEEYEVFNQGVTSSGVCNAEIDGKPVGLPYVRQQKYRDALSLNGDIYIIMLGTNDARDGLSDTSDDIDPYTNTFAFEADFEAYYQNIIDELSLMAPDAKFFLVTPIPVNHCIWRKHTEEKLLPIIDHIYHIAEMNPEVCLIDLHEEFLTLPQPTFDALYSKDGLHPNERGSMMIAQLLAYHLGNRSYGEL